MFIILLHETDHAFFFKYGTLTVTQLIPKMYLHFIVIIIRLGSINGFIYFLSTYVYSRVCLALKNIGHKKCLT